MTITHMPAHPMATTVRTGSWAESLSAPAPGSMDIGDLVSTAGLASMVAAITAGASMDAASTDDPDLLGAVDSFAARRFAAVSAAARVDSTEVVSAAADTDSSAEIYNENRCGRQSSLPAVFVGWKLVEKN